MPARRAVQRPCRLQRLSERAGCRSTGRGADHLHSRRARHDDSRKGRENAGRGAAEFTNHRPARRRPHDDGRASRRTAGGAAGLTVLRAPRHHYRRADVLIEGETIVAVGSAIDAPSGATVVDAGGCYVMPGGIDPHTHLELAFMGSVSSDDFEWGTKAALAGGTTMIVDFCIPDPGQSMLAAYQDWRRKSEKAASDYGFHMAVTSWSEQVFDEMAIVVKTYGINTFKHFMAYKGALMVNDDELYNSFARCAQPGAMPLVHAENGDVVARMQEAVLGRGVTGPEGHAYSRPPEVEGEATNRAIMIADMTGAPLYVVHTSCRESHEAIARARANGKPV